MATTPSGKRTFPGRFFLSLNLIAAGCLLFSQAAPLISPAEFWLLELVALAYPVLLAINLMFVIYWALRRHQFIFISSAIILMGYDKLTQLYQPSAFSVDVKPPKGALKVMSYNVRLFDLYNWSGNFETRKQIMSMLKDERPDLLCLQEYFQNDEGEFENNHYISEALKLPYKTIKYGLTMRKSQHWGLATFSRYPVVNEGVLFFEEGKTNFGMYSDIDVHGDTIRVYNLHLQSNHFKQRDYKFIANPDSGNKEVMMDGVRHLLKRIRSAVRKRSEQAEEIALHISQSPYPVLLCGDFNDPPFTYTYNTIRKNLKDAFTEKGKGFGATYFGFPLKFRIDYILHSQDAIMIHSYQTKHYQFSDHYPITAWFSLHHP